MRAPDGPLVEPPEVVVLDGEVLLIGERVSVAYTPGAARVLADRLALALRLVLPAEE